MRCQGQPHSSETKNECIDTQAQDKVSFMP